jgi:hypothetical protein
MFGGWLNGGREQCIVCRAGRSDATNQHRLEQCWNLSISLGVLKFSQVVRERQGLRIREG